MRYDRRVDTKGLRKVRREAEREREREAYHSAESNTMRTIVPTFAIHSNSWRRDMQPAWRLHSCGGVQLYVYRKVSARDSKLEKDGEDEREREKETFIQFNVVIS